MLGGLIYFFERFAAMFRLVSPSMRIRLASRFVLACLLGFPLALSAQQSEGSLSNYRLGSGDVISIQVLGEDDLRRDRIRLSDAATISYPILGEIKLLGKTVGELEILIRDGLRGRYLLNPQVTVTMNEYRPFFINGQVEKTGGYSYVPGLTVRKAISLAGGFRERAAKDKIFVIREGDKTQTPTRVDLSTSVNPGDIITVEESFF